MLAMRVIAMVHVAMPLTFNVITFAIGHFMPHGAMPFTTSLTLFVSAFAAHHRRMAFALHLMALHSMIVESGSGRSDRQGDRDG